MLYGHTSSLSSLSIKDIIEEEYWCLRMGEYIARELWLMGWGAVQRKKVSQEK